MIMQEWWVTLALRLWFSNAVSLWKEPEFSEKADCSLESEMSEINLGNLAGLVSKEALKD